MPFAGGLHQRVLRVAGAVAESAGAAEQGVEPTAAGTGRDGVAAAGGAANVECSSVWSGDDFVDSGDCVIGRGVFD